jgi:uracil-DNA glycosylase family 4
MADWSALEKEIIQCRNCLRLVQWREQVALQRKRAFSEWEYWGKPVPGFGDASGRLLVVGLAPGAHGSNRTGRMFTGDSSGDFLYRALYQAGFANQPGSMHRQDELRLSDVFITAVCRCVPPDNKPTQAEIDNCLPYLVQEITMLNNLKGIVALGQIAFRNVIRILGKQGNVFGLLNFNHGALYKPDADLPWILVSYHPSRQNTQTGRLTQKMFAEIWQIARQNLDSN